MLILKLLELWTWLRESIKNNNNNNNNNTIKFKDKFNLEPEFIKDFLYKATEILALVVAVSLLVGIVFGPETAFFGSVVTNFSSILSVMGQEGLLALISILIIAAILRK